ncbi:hypothetical protein H5410_047810 [Solanum commersonii]|uniref:Uncharacterized protein n=1 Tax=Solanum commersonii TaxID=4109 RepID=A0A9J5XK52_SOLCO|nr:hypothetical protein H5410_047810 [Solanum commersonii]
MFLMGYGGIGSTFNKVNEQSGVGEDPFTTFDTRSASTPTPPTTISSPRSPFTTTTHSTTTAAPKSPSTKTPPTTTAAPRSPSTTTPVTAANPSIEDADDLVSAPLNRFLRKRGFDYSTKIVLSPNVDWWEMMMRTMVVMYIKRLGSRGLKKIFSKKKKERESTTDQEVPRGKISVEGRLGGDEPYFASSDDGSFEIDEDEFSDECVKSERVHLPRTVKEGGDQIIRKLYMILLPRKLYGRTNPGSTCVVKLGEPDALGRPIFQSFYICFDPLKKAFQNCRKCIGLDGCFLKGVCRGQLLTTICRKCFNSWILAARHKTIITMLDEIRVKMMTRIAKLREFTNTWMSLNCNIEFNGVDGFEVKEGPFQHMWILVGGLVVVGYGA